MQQEGQTDIATSLVVGVTGHRQLRADDLPRLEQEVRGFFLDLQARYPELPLVLLSPLASGADSLVAGIAYDLGLRVVAPLPLPVALYREDFEDAASLARFDSQLARAEVLTLPMPRGAKSREPATPGPARDLQYAEAGIFVARHCHVLLALWDGQDQRSVGGTSHVVHFHLHGDMPVRPTRRRASMSLLGINEDTLVRHIPVVREGAVTEDTPPAAWLTADEGIVRHDDIPHAFDRMFRCQAAFNADLRRHAATFPEAPPAERSVAGCPIDGLFVAADAMARTYQRRVGRVLRATYAIAGATGGAFIIYAHVHSQDAMIYLYLLLFGAGLGLATLARRREWHRKYLDYRALAEGLRVQSYWRRAGVVDVDRPACANENFMQEQDLGLGWIRNVMRAASLEGLLVPVPRNGDAVARVIEEWVGTAGSDGQLSYFARTGDRRARHHHNAERLAMASLGVGIAIGVVLALFAHYWSYEVKTVLVVAMGLLSVGAGVHEAYAHKKADKELVKQYRFMQRIYEGARRQLDKTGDPAEQREILRILGEAAMSEHAEWTLMHRERPLEHTRLGG